MERFRRGDVVELFSFAARSRGEEKTSDSGMYSRFNIFLSIVLLKFYRL